MALSRPCKRGTAACQPACVVFLLCLLLLSFQGSNSGRHVRMANALQREPLSEPRPPRQFILLNYEDCPRPQGGSYFPEALPRTLGVGPPAVQETKLQHPPLTDKEAPAAAAGGMRSLEPPEMVSGICSPSPSAPWGLGTGWGRGRAGGVFARGPKPRLARARTSTPV